MFKFRSLHRRLAVYMLLPVAILLFAMGFAGFIYTRNHLLTQWGEAAVLKLQRAAHHVDMRLKAPKELFNMFHKSAGMPHYMLIQNVVVDQLRQLDGVERITLTRFDRNSKFSLPGRNSGSGQRMAHSSGNMQSREMMPFHRGAGVDITPPTFDAPAGMETVTLVSVLKDLSDRPVGKLEVIIRFDYLINTVQATGWWQSRQAMIVDDDGNILSGFFPKGRQKLGENGDPVEKAILYAMKSMPFGTAFGKGTPPEKVSGFYKLREAPWTLVVTSPGREILSPIYKFQKYYLFIGTGFIVLVLLLIRLVSGRTVTAIKSVSEAACNVAGGDYSESIPVKTNDEVGELVSSFNTMVGQLKERSRLKNSMNLAMEVQQNLLPEGSFSFGDLEITGTSIYCDETGGDYYDFLRFPELGNHRIAVAVGDVAGHGIASALFMTTARALIRSRAAQAGALPEMMGEVNHLLCMDTSSDGNFMTLFFLVLDTEQKRIQWVRAGHEPGLFYDSAENQFSELGGKGLALGVDEDYQFTAFERIGWTYGQVIIIGTDGLWEAENPAGERFGKQRLREIIRRHSYLPAPQILTAITDALYAFIEGAAIHDDVTLVIIKVRKNGNHTSSTPER